MKQLLTIILSAHADPKLSVAMFLIIHAIAAFCFIYQVYSFYRKDDHTYFNLIEYIFNSGPWFVWFIIGTVTVLDAGICFYLVSMFVASYL